MREKRVIIGPPERKFSKQTGISKGKEESKREGRAVRGMKGRSTHSCQFCSGSQVYYIR